LNTPNTGDFEVMWPADARAIFADRKQNALGTRLGTLIDPHLSQIMLKYHVIETHEYQ
jgi:hypothetical protein